VRRALQSAGAGAQSQGSCKIAFILFFYYAILHQIEDWQKGESDESGETVIF
jgi:hypothetical protein